jgi:putative ABC transport system permease protein
LFYVRYALSELRRRRGRTASTVIALAAGGVLTVTLTNAGIAVLVLVGSVVIASLLALSSVAERRRELATLQAMGWSRGLVVRQIAGEALVQGIVGGALGALVAPLAAVPAIGGGLVAGAVGALSVAGLGPWEAACSTS